MSNLDDLSKFLSLVLRHKPEVINLVMDKNGWVSVEDLLKGMRRKGYKIDLSILEQIVVGDKKQRYSFNEDKSKIRANQGHSIKVDVGFKELQPPNVLYHGTATRFMKSIMSKSLIGMSRLYVHLSADEETAVSVGIRHGRPAILLIDATKMYEDGHKFYLSENGVWLCKDVPTKYITRL